LKCFTFFVVLHSQRRGCLSDVEMKLASLSWRGKLRILAKVVGLEKFQVRRLQSFWLSRFSCYIRTLQSIKTCLASLEKSSCVATLRLTECEAISLLPLQPFASSSSFDHTTLGTDSGNSIALWAAH